MNLKHLISTSLIALGLSSSAFSAESPAGYFDIGSLTPSAKGDYVEVNIEQSLLSFASRLAAMSEPDAAAMLRDINNVRVNVVKLDESNLEKISSAFSGAKDKLVQAGWMPAVSVREKGDTEVGVFVKSGKDDEIQGLVITVLDENKEAVFVNIVGNIRPEHIGKLGAKLNIDSLSKIHNGKHGLTIIRDPKDSSPAEDKENSK